MLCAVICVLNMTLYILTLFMLLCYFASYFLPFLTTLTATEIQKVKHAARGDNSEQTLMKYFQMFVQNKADKLLGNQATLLPPSKSTRPLADTRTNTSPCPLGVTCGRTAHKAGGERGGV